MSEQAIEVGDVVAWDKVPSGALVREEDGDERGAHTVRIRDEGYVVLQVRGRPKSWQQFDFDETWEWEGPQDVERATIIALGLTGNETAEHLRGLAEVFDVRDALFNEPEIVEFMHTSVEDLNSYECPSCSPDEPQAWTWAAERLHRTGWRPGMSAEDAAAMLAMPPGWSVVPEGDGQWAAMLIEGKGGHLSKPWRNTPREAAEDANRIAAEDAARLLATETP